MEKLLSYFKHLSGVTWWLPPGFSLVTKSVICITLAFAFTIVIMVVRYWLSSLKEDDQHKRDMEKMKLQSKLATKHRDAGATEISIEKDKIQVKYPEKKPTDIKKAA
jgi:hypothetical protein